MDEQQAFDAIEQAAAPYVKAGWEPVDAEPGEWLILSHPGKGRMTISVVNDAIVIETPIEEDRL